MKTLITPIQVLKLAFANGEYLPPESITLADIAAAEQRWIVPVLGRALHEKLLSGAYAEFTSDYLAATTALFTRTAIQSRLDIRTERCGTLAPKSPYGQPADEKAMRRMQRQLLRQAQTLLHRAAEELAAHNDAFPEYDPQRDILTHCSTYGNLVQVH